MEGRRNAVVFGTGGFAEVVRFYLENDSDYAVAGFTATADAVQQDTIYGLPLCPFEEIEQRFPPDGYEMFIAVGYKGLNTVRERFYREAKEKGYRMLSYVCSKATTWGATELGDNVFVFEDNTIQPFTSIGENTILWSGNHLGHHSSIGPHCFITSHVVISGYCRVGSHCFIGVNATIADDTEIGDRNIIGPGALIQKNTRPDQVYVAEKARLFPKPSSRFMR